MKVYDNFAEVYVNDEKIMKTNSGENRKKADKNQEFTLFICSSFLLVSTTIYVDN